MNLKSLIPLGSAFAAVMMVASYTPAAAEDEFTESHLNAAREVVAVTDSLSTFDDILPLLAEQTRTLFIQSDPSRTQEVIDVTNDVALQLAAKRGDLNGIIYEVWARRFTEEELRELAVFYQSPLGAKLTKNGPTITALSIGAARQWQDAISTEMVSLVREELDKRAAAPAAE